MKKLLIAIIVIIISIFAYNQYKTYQRFNPENTNYNVSQMIDIDYYDQLVVFGYHDAVQSLNAYITMQWSANGIDVISPENEEAETVLAVDSYANKRAKVKFYEVKLEQSKRLKDKGFSNKGVQLFENTGLTEEAYNKQLEADKFRDRLLSELPRAYLRSGEKSAFIYEVQKLLVKKGYDIPLDGVYKSITEKAILDFETKANLFVDGNIDQLTLEALLD